MKINLHKPFPATILLLFLVGFACQVNLNPANAQATTPVAAPDYTLSVRRTFGYSAGGEIRGSFRLSVADPQENIQQVVFLIDDQLIGMVTESPSQMDIHTQDYPEGTHTLRAEVTTVDGSVEAVQGGTYNFVYASEQWAGVLKIFVAIGIILVLIAGIGFLFTYLTTGKTVKDLPLGAERHYGIQGGGICNRCGRPFAFHWWGLNLGGYKYDRCDYCGRSNKAKRLSREELRKAEQAELASTQQAQLADSKSPDQKYKEMLDQSRYMD